MPSVTPTNAGRLRRVLEDAMTVRGLSMCDLTVLAKQRDPYRLDTPTGHAEAEWFARHFTHAIERRGRPTLHLRGSHYAFLVAEVVKRNGKPYLNTDPEWCWLGEGPAKTARWLGYVPFEMMTDARADPPVIHRASQTSPYGLVSVGRLGLSIPETVAIEPSVTCSGFVGRQPFHLIIFGEKSSLADVVLPIAEAYGADAYLEAGEISDSHVYQMAADNQDDGRPLRVFTLSDCDPAGWQMAVSIGRKLQALRDLRFPDMDFEVITVALMPEQVSAFNLPSTPLKPSEARADRWRRAMGIEQTEIDALATLRPEDLTTLLESVLDHYFDHTLASRVARAKQKWLQNARVRVNTQVDLNRLDAINRDAAKLFEAVGPAADDIDERLDAFERDVNQVALPRIRIPQPVLDSSPNGHRPLIASRWEWTEQTLALKARKAYEDEP